MDFALSETQQLLSDSATDFFSRQVDAARLREMAQGHQYDAALWRALAGQGWLGLGFESGIASNLAEQALVAEAAGYAAAPVPYTDTVSALAALAGWPAAAATRTAVMSGDRILAVVDGREDFTATGGGETQRLSGAAARVPYGRVADAFVVITTGEGGAALHLVDASAVGVQRRDRDSMAYDASASLTLQEVDAPSVALSAEALEDWLLRRAVCAAAEAVGAARRSVELAVDYAMNRVQFGRPIGAFQAVQHPCADMALGLDGARFALREAAWAVDEGPDGVEDAAAVAHSALAYAHKALLHITANSHEVFGGVGFFVEHDLHYYTRRIASDLAVMGPASGHLEAVADAAGI